jgi:integrase
LNDFELKEWSDQIDRPCRLKIHGKGSKERPVIVPPKLMMRIVKWIKKKGDLSSRDRLFGVKENRWHKVFVASVQESGIMHKYTLHDLRRSKGTEWINNLGINEAKYRLGHADISTTQRYFNRDEEQQLKKWEGEY